MNPDFVIRIALRREFPRIGALLVETYASIPGMPSVDAQPEYYERLSAVAHRQADPSIDVFAAVDARGDVLGSVDYVGDMSGYASGGSAASLEDAAGIRLLVVAPGHRRRGIGRDLTEFCIARARAAGRRQVILHSTRAMLEAWTMYEGMGFQRFPEIDFRQGDLEVFGFRLPL